MRDGSPPTWIDFMLYVTRQYPQDQRALVDQLNDLIFIASRLGMHDAADFIRMHEVTPEVLRGLGLTAEVERG